MKLSELKNRISLRFSGYGHWKVTYTTPSGKVRVGITTDSTAIDRLNSDELTDLQRGDYGYTYKGALECLLACTKN